MKLRFALATATCFVLPVMAHAQPVTGPYVSLGGGTSILSPVTSEYKTTLGNDTGKVHYNVADAFAGGVGYGLGNGLRVELSANYTRNTASSLAIDGTSYKAVGAEEKYGAMANVYYDFNVGLPIYPYVGGGAGYQFVKFNRDLSVDPNSDGFPIKTGGTKGGFAFDLIAGVSYPLPMLP